MARINDNFLLVTLFMSLCSPCTIYISAFPVSSWASRPFRRASIRRSVDSRSAFFVTLKKTDSQEDEEANLENEINDFLGGGQDISPAPAGLTPRETIESVLVSLRNVNKPQQAHGAAVLQRFCAPLSRGERWGGDPNDAWKEVLRGAITPNMLAQRIRASAFSVLLDWTKFDITDGYSMKKGDVPSLAFVNAALFFGDGVEPCLVQFTLRRFGGDAVWLIDTARVSKKELFVQQSSNATNWKDS